jgi:hypothetical protein
MALVGLGLAVIGDFGVAIMLVITWVALSTTAVSIRGRLGPHGWRHGSAGVWWWWWAPVFALWKPRAVYAEIMERAHPHEDRTRLVGAWWVWWLVFALTPLLLLIPGGAWWLFAAAALPLIPAVMATFRASTMLDSLSSPTAAVVKSAVMPTLPGWYHDPSGRATHQAWWDGDQWTGATRPGP